jgi:hypothetical protein
MGFCKSCKKEVSGFSRVEDSVDGAKFFHCPQCFTHTPVSLWTPKTVCTNCSARNAAVPISNTVRTTRPQLSKPPRYREVVPSEPKADLKLTTKADIEDFDDLTVEESEDAGSDEGSDSDASSLCRARMAVEDYRSHELRQSRGEVTKLADHYEVHCAYEDLEDMVKIGKELIANEPVISFATLRIGRLVLDVHLKTQSKDKVAQALSRSLMTSSKTSARRGINKAKEAASKGGYDAVTSEEFSLMDPLLQDIKQLRDGLMEQLDEVKAVKNSFMRRIQNLDSTRKIEDSIELTRRYEMSACSTPRPGSRLGDLSGSSTPRSVLRPGEVNIPGKQEELEKELGVLQEQLREGEGDPRSTSKISTRISRIKTELQALKTRSILHRTKTMKDRNVRSSLSMSFDGPIDRPSSAFSGRRSSIGMTWGELAQNTSMKSLELDSFDGVSCTSVALSSDVMKEQLALRRERQEIEEQRMKMEIEAEAAKRKLAMQVASLATQKEQLEADRKVLQQERSMQMQLSRENLRRRSQLQGLFQHLMARAEESRLDPQQDLFFQDIQEQLLS